MDIQEILNTITADMQAMPDKGKVADYIPQLASVDPDQFGMAVALPDGTVFRAGDADTSFSIQSVSKVFTLTLALGRFGDQLWTRVGREPSGLPFNSILQLEHENGIPRNPFINAGALAVTDAILTGYQPKELLAELLRFVQSSAEDDSIVINNAVAYSETQHGDRNMSLAHFMAAHGNLQNRPELTCGTYFHQCALQMSCAQLARAGRYLTGHPEAPKVVSLQRVRRINALMLTCGHYDASGDFAYRVGLPGKSGVGGAILAIAPGKAAICAWSPGLNDYGNSKRGTRAMERFAHMTGWSVFG